MTHSQAITILVIDDDDNFRHRIARAFRDRHYQVLEANGSSAALMQLETQTIDWILLDLKLGEESGLSLLKEITDLTEAKVVVLTGYGTIATAVEAVKLGAVNYLTKPIDADTVLCAFEHRKTSSVETPHLAQVEWDYIQRVVSDHNGNISHASKALGLHRRSLQRKLTKKPQKLK
jgi:two-component system response regulator RegA